MFDSGVGGLSVLRAVQRTLPNHPLRYVADSAHAPYGERDERHVINRSTAITQHLVDAGAGVIVIACNTATAIAAQGLRQTWPLIRFVGVEPGIKPALASSPRGSIGVMATAATLASAKFNGLLNMHRAGKTVHLQACTGLAAAIESGHLDSADIAALVDRHCRPLRDACVDTVVLGCTHYPFVEHLIRAAMGPEVAIIDTAHAVSRRVAQVVAESGNVEARGADPGIVLESTGDVDALSRFACRWLPFAFECRRVSIEGRACGARDGD